MKNLTQKLVLIFSLAGVAIAYQNCGSKHAYTPEQLQQLASNIPDTQIPASDGGVTPPPVIPGEINAKLQLGDMVMRSMSSLTGVPVTNAAVVTEYGLRAASMAGSLDPQAVTSPLMIAVADLASVYCNTAITTESPAGATRRLFTGVDFTVAINATSYEAMVRRLAQILWGRDLTAAELTILQQRFTAFNAGFAAGVAAGTRTRTTALYACTAMLSVFDVLTF